MNRSSFPGIFRWSCQSSDIRSMEPKCNGSFRDCPLMEAFRLVAEAASVGKVSMSTYWRFDVTYRRWQRRPRVMQIRWNLPPNAPDPCLRSLVRQPYYLFAPGVDGMSTSSRVCGVFSGAALSRSFPTQRGPVATVSHGLISRQGVSFASSKLTLARPSATAVAWKQGRS